MRSRTSVVLPEPPFPYASKSPFGGITAPLSPSEASGSEAGSTRAVVFTSKDQNLNKAHVRYLESRLIRLALDAL